MYKVIVSPRARRDLLQIVSFIAEDNPGAAEQFGRAVLNHIELLAHFPHIGVPLSGKPGIRKVLHSPVRVYYRVGKTQANSILHFWHSAGNEPKL